MVPFRIIKNVSACNAWSWLKPVDNPFCWLSSLCVAIMLCCVLGLLTIPVFDSLESECLQHILFCFDDTPVFGSPGSVWLQSLVFPTCWQHISLAHQRVSECVSLTCFKLTDGSCSWLFSWWVAAKCCCTSRLQLTFLGSLECEWPPADSISPFLLNPYLAHQEVCVYSSFKPVNISTFWFFSLYVFFIHSWSKNLTFLYQSSKVISLPTIQKVLSSYHRYVSIWLMIYYLSSSLFPPVLGFMNLF